MTLAYIEAEDVRSMAPHTDALGRRFIAIEMTLTDAQRKALLRDVLGGMTDADAAALIGAEFPGLVKVAV